MGELGDRIKILNLEKKALELELKIIKLEQENALLKASNVTKPVATYAHTGKVKELCDCVDWRDMSPSPFCHKCRGAGSY